MTKPKRKFRLFRFSLKTLLVFMLLSGIYLGIVIPKQQRAKRESDAMASIQGEYQGEFLYGYQLEGDKNNPVPDWIQSVLGEHTFATVKRISLEGAGGSYLGFVQYPEDGDQYDLAAELDVFRNVEELHVESSFGQMADLNCLAKMKKLRELSIESAGSLESLSGLESCSELGSLQINNVAANSFDALGELSKLSELSIVRCFNVESLLPIAAHRGLKSLQIDRVPSIKSLDFLTSFKNLESFTLTHAANGIDRFDFQLIQQNEGLREIRIGSFDGFASTEVLGEFSNLESLQLEYSDYEFDLSMFASNANTLQKLRLNCCHGLRTLDGIESFGELEELEINWCSGLTDLDALLNHPKLKSLTIRNMPIDVLPKLEKFPELERLEFHKLMKVKDLDALASLRAPKLKQLVFDDCIELMNVKGLESLLGGEVIEFKACAFVEDAEIKRLRDQFPSCDVVRRDRH